MLCLQSTPLHPCPECDKVYQNKDSLTRHQRRHGEDSMFKCDICHKEYETRGTLKTHIETKHHRIPVGSCDVCGKKFYSDSGLKRHVRTHAGEFVHKCTICEPVRGFQEKHALEAHMVTSHNLPMMYMCDLCGKQCNSTATLARHRNLFHAAV